MTGYTIKPVDYETTTGAATAGKTYIWSLPSGADSGLAALQLAEHQATAAITQSISSLRAKVSRSPQGRVTASWDKVRHHVSFVQVSCACSV